MSNLGSQFEGGVSQQNSRRLGRPMIAFLPGRTDSLVLSGVYPGWEAENI